VAVHARLIPPGTLGPAQRTPPPPSVARVCMNGHLADGDLEAAVARGVGISRADPLAVATTDVACVICGAGTILGCPGCGYPIPGRRPALRYDVPHFCVVCGEFYPWTFRGEFFATLEEILLEAPLLQRRVQKRARALAALDRQREGLATLEELAGLVDTFRGLGGSDWDLAAQILRVVLPPETASRLDLAARFMH
jgi:hypothetical protein